MEWGGMVVPKVVAGHSRQLWDGHSPWHHGLPNGSPSPVPAQLIAACPAHWDPSAMALCHSQGHTLPRALRQWPRDAKSPPAHPAGSWSGLVPVLNKRKEPLVSSSVSQYFTELCFPYLVQLKSRGEVLYKSKFF